PSVPFLGELGQNPERFLLSPRVTELVTFASFARVQRQEVLELEVRRQVVAADPHTCELRQSSARLPSERGPSVIPTSWSLTYDEGAFQSSHLQSTVPSSSNLSLFSSTSFSTAAKQRSRTQSRSV